MYKKEKGTKIRLYIDDNQGPEFNEKCILFWEVPSNAFQVGTKSIWKLKT